MDKKGNLWEKAQRNHCEGLKMHYYSKKPERREIEQILSLEIGGKKYRFFTGTGVFSKKQLDKGTKLLIEYMKPKGKTLDLGCGWGIIGIVAAKEYKCDVDMVDINEWAVQLAKLNAKMNKVRVKVYRQDAESFLMGKKEVYDTILTNPPIRIGKEKIQRWIVLSKDALKEKGTFWMVVKTKHGAKGYAAFLDELFGNVETVKISGGYRVLKAKKVMVNEKREKENDGEKRKKV